MTNGRQPVNLGAVIGVVFVFLTAVAVWVIVDTVSGDDTADAPTTDVSAPASLPLVTAADTAPAVTSPVPMPTSLATTPATKPPSSPPTTSPLVVPTTTSATTEPATTPPPAQGGGDLGIIGHPIVRPDCTGSYITVLASAIGANATASSVGSVLDRYTDASYLRTDQACGSLRQQVDGQPIYVVFLGPFADAASACAARSSGSGDAYVRTLSNDQGPGHTVNCN